MYVIVEKQEKLVLSIRNIDEVYAATVAGSSLALLHDLRELSHLSSLIKIALATIAVSLHWPVLPG